MERESGKNYVFEQFAKEKKQRNINSTSNLVNFGSPQTKINPPAKIMMNQTVSGGFHRAGPQGSSKSESKPTRHLEQFGTNNPATKKYLEQLE
jgi:hypothetical protein